MSFGPAARSRLTSTPSLAALAAGLLVATSSGSARAQATCSGSASPCVNSDALWSTPGPSRFAHVSATETTNPGDLAIGVVTSYQSRPLVLRTASPGPGAAGTDSYAVDNQVTANFLWQYGITQRLAFDAALPITLGQSGDGLSALTGGSGLKFTAIRDFRFGLALAIVPRERTDLETTQKRGGPGNAYSLTLRLGTSAPIGDKAELASERTAVFLPSLAGDYRVGRFIVGAEVGARVRPTTDLLGARIGTQLLTAVGVGVDVLPRELLSFGLEARALANLAEQADVTRSAGGLVSTPNGRYVFPAEWMLSARTAPLPSGDFTLFFGGGGGLTQDTATVPRFRFVLGVTYAPRGRDSDGDGILDRLDQCPHEPARGEPRDGCDHEKGNEARP